MKKNEKIKRGICETVKELNPTVRALCRRFGITTRTFYYWKMKDEAFRKAYEEAVQEYLTGLNIDAKKSLAKLVKGFTVTDTKTFYGSDKNGEAVIVQVIETKREIPPSVEAVKFALTNLDPSNFEK